MQSLLGVDLFGTHGDDMKQISDKKEHQTQNRMRGRIKFIDKTTGNAKGTAPFATMIIVMRKNP